MIKFKRAGLSDIILIQELARKSWNSAYRSILKDDQISYMLRTMYSVEEITTHLENPNYHYYIIQTIDSNAGFIGFENRYEKNTTKLHRIYLLEEFKGKGLGKKSLDFIKIETLKSGDHRIILNVNKNNPAKEIYEKQGYTVYNAQVFDIGKGYVMDDYLMELKLH